MMMLQNIKNIALQVLIMMLCSTVYAQQFTHTTGNIAGLGNGWIKFSYEFDDTLYQDSVQAKSDAFEIKIPLVETAICTLSTSVNKQIRIFIVENSPVKVNGVADKIYELNISGSKENDLFNDYKMNLAAIPGKRPSLSGNQDADKAALSRYAASLQLLKDSVLNHFISANPDRVSSAIAIFNMYVTYPDRIKAADAYSKLSAGVRQSGYGKEIKQFIDAEAITIAGALAPEFSLKDGGGKMVSLKDFSGKYVLIDFWASWCGPCRLENPNLIKAYQKFKGKGFTIVGLSMDSSKENWLKAVEQDKLSWIQLNDPKSTSGKTAGIYGVKSLPANFLVDPSGKIIARNLRGNALEEQLNSIFNK
ncbi:Thiol-disulfide oxidoreductase ResA [compost metagenome]|uniref:TlpA disulfide reductase family protein n=1 Tax=Pedobacter ghigonis TaxID=2730403 RepID=UPI000FAB5550|nr:TlpA disulfide reductase family protein [Pedobacter ghigonis]